MPGKRKEAIFSSSSCFLSVCMSTCFTGENAKDESERRSFYSPLHRVTWGHMGSSKGEGEGGETPRKKRGSKRQQIKVYFIAELDVTVCEAYFCLLVKFICSAHLSSLYAVFLETLPF